jgi:hypothetical protein
MRHNTYRIQMLLEKIKYVKGFDIAINNGYYNLATLNYCISWSKVERPDKGAFRPAGMS